MSASVLFSYPAIALTKHIFSLGSRNVVAVLSDAIKPHLLLVKNVSAGYLQPVAIL
jgi:hypothetical protein